MAALVIMAAQALGASAATAATMGTIASTVGTISTIGSMVSGVQAARSEGAVAKATANYNAQIANQNASLANQQTALEVRERQRANYLSRSENINHAGHASGSVLDILASNAEASEMDILNTKYNGLLQQNAYLNNASLERARGANAKRASRIGMGTALLNGMGKIAGSYAGNSLGASR